MEQCQGEFSKNHNFMGQNFFGQVMHIDIHRKKVEISYAHPVDFMWIIRMKNAYIL